MKATENLVFPLLFLFLVMTLEVKIKQQKPLGDELKLMLQIVYLHSRIQQMQQKLFRKYEVTPQQYNVLRIVRGQNKPCSLKTIKERMLDINSDVSRLTDRLVKKAYLSRNYSEHDRRECLIQITAKGKKILNDLKDTDDKFRFITRVLTKKELRHAITILDKIIHAWEHEITSTSSL